MADVPLGVELELLLLVPDIVVLEARSRWCYRSWCRWCCTVRLRYRLCWFPFRLTLFHSGLACLWCVLWLGVVVESSTPVDDPVIEGFVVVPTAPALPVVPDPSQGSSGMDG